MRELKYVTEEITKYSTNGMKINITEDMGREHGIDYDDLGASCK